MVWEERPQRLEARVDALHTTSLVAVGDLTTDSFLLLLLAVGRTPTLEKKHTRNTQNLNNKLLQTAR